MQLFLSVPYYTVQSRIKILRDYMYFFLQFPGVF